MNSLSKKIEIRLYYEKSELVLLYLFFVILNFLYICICAFMYFFVGKENWQFCICFTIVLTFFVDIIDLPPLLKHTQI